MKKLITMSGLVLLIVMLGSISVAMAESGNILNVSVSDKTIVFTIIPYSDFDSKVDIDSELNYGRFYYGVYDQFGNPVYGENDYEQLTPYKAATADKQIKLFLCSVG